MRHNRVKNVTVCVFENMYCDATPICVLPVPTAGDPGYRGSPLHVAILQRNRVTALRMIREGVCPLEEPDCIGHTPLGLAVALSEKAVVSALIERGCRSYVASPAERG